jgi:Fe-Mn family superoxide dismutase
MSSEFEKVIKTSFGSVESFKEKFIASATAVFGSGWTWLIKDRDELLIKNTPNQDNPLMLGEKAILGIDVWEHAYYLKCQNRRPEYLANIWHVIDWEQVEKNYNSKR